MTTRDEYIDEMSGLARMLAYRFRQPARFVALTGGVAAIDLKLPYDKYDEAKEYLTDLLGEPEQLESWHPSHTKDVPPLKFKVTAEMNHMQVSHVNLISMKQRKDKRYVLISMM